MLSKVRAAITASLFLTLAGCHHQITSWRDVAAATGCDPALLARSAAYDSTQVRQLIGSYRLVQVDTTPGWAEVEGEHGSPGESQSLRLWAADSVNAYWRTNHFTGTRGRVNRPLAGALAGHEREGFTAEDPQAEVSGRALDRLVVVFSPKPVLDGTMWMFPIERMGSWGFGGYFVEESNVVPVGRDGQALGARAGYYCAFRV